jgi:hypothetical protein
VLQVIGQQLSTAAARAILARLEALHGGRLPTPAELLATDAETLRGIGLSRPTSLSRRTALLRWQRHPGADAYSARSSRPTRGQGTQRSVRG